VHHRRYPHARRVQALRTGAPREAIPVHYDDYTLFKSPLPDFRKAADRDVGP